MRKKIYLMMGMVLLMVSCARVDITKISSDHPYRQGIRFYRPHPYLWVTKDKDGSLKGTIYWLPNKNEEYVIRVKSGIGTVDTKFTLENGWNLTQFGETRDSKTPEMIEALSGSLQEVTEVLKMLKKEELHPGLYQFVFDEKTGMFHDIKPVVQFR
jgi:nitrogen fixation protein